MDLVKDLVDIMYTTDTTNERLSQGRWQTVT